MKIQKMMLMLGLFEAVVLMACEDVAISGQEIECEIDLDCDDSDECTMDVCTSENVCRHESMCYEGVDLDGDGFAYPEDCDDRRADVYPGAEEICDIIHDNDCDGQVDEEACEYDCPVVYDFCRDDVESDQVALSLASTSSCHPDSPGPWRQDGSGFYVMHFAVENLGAGDVIERFELAQTAGDAPLPPAGSEPVTAMLSIRGRVGEGNSEFFLANVAQADDGAFRFEGITVPSDFDADITLNVEMVIPYVYSGYFQLSLVELDDFQVRDKVTMTQRCTAEPQPGGFYMVLCPDWDGDGHDSVYCGGDDSDDSDPTVR